MMDIFYGWILLGNPKGDDDKDGDDDNDDSDNYDDYNVKNPPLLPKSRTSRYLH